MSDQFRPGGSGPSQHDANAGQPAASPLPNSQPAGTPSEPAAPKRGARNIVIIVAAVLVVAALIFAGSRLLGGGATGSAGAGTATPANKYRTPDAAINAYFAALNAGDAASIIAMAESVPTDTTLLTNDVLTQATQDTQITEVSIAESTDKDTFPVTYTIAGHTVSDTFQLNKDSAGSYRLATIALPMSVNPIPASQVGLRVNGVPVTSSKITVFPGTYTMTLDSAMYQLQPDTFVVDSLVRPPSLSDNQISLTDQGIDDVRKAAKEHLTWCLANKETIKPECGLNYTGTFDDQKLVTDSLECKVSSGGGAIDRAEIVVNSNDVAQMAAELDMKWNCVMKAENGKLYQGTHSVPGYNAEVTSEGVKVTFR